MIKKNICLLLFVLFTMPAFAQQEKYINVDIGLLQVHQDFFKLYDGVFDLGANYNRLLFSSFYAGVDFHLGYIHRKNTTGRTSIYKPGIIFNYHILVTQKFAVIPQARLGYAFLSLSNNEFNYREMQSGWNPGAEIRLLWKRDRPIEFYGFGRFDYIYLTKDEAFTKLNSYRHVYLTSFGLGIQIKSGKK